MNLTKLDFIRVVRAAAQSLTGGAVNNIAFDAVVDQPIGSILSLSGTAVLIPVECFVDVAFMATIDVAAGALAQCEIKLNTVAAGSDLSFNLAPMVGSSSACAVGYVFKRKVTAGSLIYGDIYVPSTVNTQTTEWTRPVMTVTLYPV